MDYQLMKRSSKSTLTYTSSRACIYQHLFPQICEKLSPLHLLYLLILLLWDLLMKKKYFPSISILLHIHLTPLITTVRLFRQLVSCE